MPQTYFQSLLHFSFVQFFDSNAATVSGGAYHYFTIHSPRVVVVIGALVVRVVVAISACTLFNVLSYRNCILHALSAHIRSTHQRIRGTHHTPSTTCISSSMV